MRLPPCSQVMMKVSILPTTSPPQLGQVAKHLSRTFAPFVAEGGEIAVPLIESPPPLHFQAVPLVANQVDGHAHRQVAAHGRIEGHQDTLRGVCQGSVLRKYAVEDRLSVLGFTGLEEGRVGPCFDKVALSIGPEQPYRLTDDLPTDDERGIEADVVLFQIPGVAFLDIAHRVRDQPHDVEHRPGTHQIGGRVAVSTTLSQYADDGLSAGQVSRTQQNDNAVAATLEHRHLAELGEAIHPGMRTRVRGENHALVEHYADTVGHAMRLLGNRTPFAMPPASGWRQTRVSDCQSGCKPAPMPSRTPSLRRSTCGSR